LRLLAIDEAHCLSPWGHEFRPDYLQLGVVRKKLGGVPTVALTATATPEVQDDILKHLGIDHARRFILGFDRPNLKLRVVSTQTRQQKKSAMLSHLGENSTLIYCATRKNVEWVYAALRSEGVGAGMYHAGLSNEERAAVQDAFMADRCRVIVATNAFGMGIDKHDIRTIIHWDIPGTIEAYYQEIGRAGRDGEPASAVLLFRDSDRRTQEFFIQMANPPAAAVHAVWRWLQLRGEETLMIGSAELAQALPNDSKQRQASSALVVLRREGYVKQIPNDSEELLQIEVCKPGARLLLNEAQMQRRREWEYARLDQMVSYVRAGCRRRVLVTYFGQEPPWERCGTCDACQENRPLHHTPFPLTEAQRLIVRQLLACMARMGRPFSGTLIAKVAAGSRDKTVRAFGFERLSTHGILSQYSVRDIQGLLAELVHAGAIRSKYTTRHVRGREHTYQELSLTALGKSVMRQVCAEFLMVFPENLGHAPSREAVGLALPPVLAAVRAQLARAEGVSPRKLLPDSTIAEIGRVRPMSISGLRNISGMGPARVRRYGHALLAALQAEE